MQATVMDKDKFTELGIDASQRRPAAKDGVQETEGRHARR